MIGSPPGITPSRGATAALTLAATVLAIAFSLPFFTGPLRPWPDQAWTLEAAMRHSRGLGLTSSMDNSSADITRPKWVHMSYFPPLYPLTVSAMLRAGASVGGAVKIVNAVALVAGTVSWMLLASRLLTPRWLAGFAVLLVTVAGAPVPKGGTTDYVFWALVPLWFAALARSTAPGAGERPLRWTALSSLVVSLLIGFRWAAAFLVPAGVLLIVWARRRELRLLVLQGLVYGGPPTAVFAAIGAVNRALSGSATVLDRTPRVWAPELLLTPYPFEALFSIPLGLHAIARRVVRGVSLPGLLEIGIQYLLPALALVALLYASVRSGREAWSAFPRTAAAVLGTLVLFLAAMSLRYAWVDTNWSYLDEPRYYRPFFPLAALLWLTLLPRSGRASRAIPVAAMLIGAYLLQGTARFTSFTLREPDPSVELNARVLAISSAPGTSVVFDVTIDDHLLHQTDAFLARVLPPPEDVTPLCTSRETAVWIVRRVGFQDPYSPVRDFPEKKFRAMRELVRADRVWSSSDGSFELYAARIQPGCLTQSGKAEAPES